MLKPISFSSFGANLELRDTKFDFVALFTKFGITQVLLDLVASDPFKKYLENGKVYPADITKFKLTQVVGDLRYVLQYENRTLAYMAVQEPDLERAIAQQFFQHTLDETPELNTAYSYMGEAYRGAVKRSSNNSKGLLLPAGKFTIPILNKPVFKVNCDSTGGLFCPVDNSGLLINVTPDSKAIRRQAREYLLELKSTLRRRWGTTPIITQLTTYGLAKTDMAITYRNDHGFGFTVTFIKPKDFGDKDFSFPVYVKALLTNLVEA